MNQLTEYAQLLLAQNLSFDGARTEQDDKYYDLRGTLPHYKYRHYYSDTYYSCDLINNLLQQCELYWDSLQHRLPFETTGVLRHLWLPAQPHRFNSHIDSSVLTLKIGEKLGNQPYKSLLGQQHTGNAYYAGVPHGFITHKKLDRQALVYFIVAESDMTHDEV